MQIIFEKHEFALPLKIGIGLSTREFQIALRTLLSNAITSDIDTRLELLGRKTWIAKFTRFLSYYRFVVTVRFQRH